MYEYRMQVIRMVDHLVVVIKGYELNGQPAPKTARMYTISSDALDEGGFVEFLGQLQRVVAESEG